MHNTSKNDSAARSCNSNKTIVANEILCFANYFFLVTLDKTLIEIPIQEFRGVNQDSTRSVAFECEGEYIGVCKISQKFQNIFLWKVINYTVNSFTVSRLEEKSGILHHCKTILYFNSL